jgi:RNA polymerase sigma factor (sigma-70 family)
MSESLCDLTRAKEGSEGALVRIYEEFSPKVLATVRRRFNGVLRQIYDSEDLLQSVFYDLISRLTDLEDRGRRALGGLLGRIAERKVISKYRRHLQGSGGRREQTVLDLEAAAGFPGPVSQLMRREEAVAIRCALAGLAPQDQEVLLLRTVEGLSHAEVALRMGLGSEDAARKRHARALQKLATGVEGPADSIIEVIGWMEGGHRVSYEWIRENYPTSGPRLLDVFRVMGALRPPPFERIGPYRILEFLGCGPHGNVYLGEAGDSATDHGAGRQVAVKVLHAHAVDPESFQGAGDAVNSFRHPSVLPCRSAGVHRGRGVSHCYLVSEFSTTPTLGAALEAGRASDLPGVRALGLSLCGGLRAIHRALPAHGDLKPDNVLLDPEIGPRLMDHGLAPVWSENLLGLRKFLDPRCIRYVAPEIRAGGVPDVRSDLYSLGIVLEEALALTTESGPGLRPIIRSLTAQQPAKRPRDLQEVIEALEAAA